MAWFYAIEYPIGLNRDEPVYPYKLTVHRYAFRTSRDDKVAYERMRNLLRYRWFRVRARHPLVQRALRETGEDRWPAKLLIEAPAKEKENEPPRPDAPEG